MAQTLNLNNSKLDDGLTSSFLYFYEAKLHKGLQIAYILINVHTSGGTGIYKSFLLVYARPLLKKKIKKKILASQCLGWRL